MSNATSPLPAFAGVDGGKASLQLAISFDDGKFLEKTCPNTPDGRAALVALCAQHRARLVVLEATGGLELYIAAELAREQIPVSVINPRPVQVLCQGPQPAGQNRRQRRKASGSFARKLSPAPSQIPSETQRNLREIAALAPFNRDSGAMTGQRAIKGGRQDLRTCLYMATVTAIRCNPIIKAFYEELVGRGKKKIVALIAAMRKLLTILNSMQREKKTWSEFTTQPFAI